jgi:molybdenum cofactor synthesis domain-containing protein
VISLGRLPLAETGHAAPGCWVRVLQDLPEDSAPLELAVWKQGLSLAWVTLSDKGAAGERSDASGPLLEELARAALDIGHAQGFLLPDEEPGLRALLTDLALTQGYDLILTTGGTGVGPRDVTPQATLAVIEKRLPGFEQAMTAASLAKTPHGAISRAVAGTLGPALIVNLPGSRKAVAENLEAVLPAAAHCIAKLQGDPSECGG